MAASDVRSKNVNIYINDDAAIDAYNRLQKDQDKYSKAVDQGRKKIEQLEKAIAKAKAEGGKTSPLIKELDKQNKALAANEKALKKTTDQQAKLKNQIDSGTGPSLRQQEAYVRRLTNEYKNLSQGTEEAEKKLRELGEASKVLDAMTQRLHNVTNAQNQVAKSGGWLSSFFGNLAANLVMKAGAAIKDFFKGALDEALAAEEGAARLKATLDNLGKSDVFDRLVAKADQMAERFKYLDNDDVLDVFEKLIDYGKLTEKQMNDLLPVIINFAAKQRISIQESTSVIIKALSGNAKALKEYGVSVKDAGSTSERLDIIMTTLASKVEGAGDTFSKTAKGGIEEVKTQFNDLKEQIGTGLLPMLNKLLSFALKAIQGLKSVSNIVSDIFSGDKTFRASVIGQAAKINDDARAYVEENYKAGLALFKSGMKMYDEAIKSGRVTEEQAFNEQLNGLIKSQEEREKLIEKLNKSFDSDGGKMSPRQREAARLSNIQRLKNALTDYEATQRLINDLKAERATDVLGLQTPDDKKDPKEDPALKKLLEDLKRFEEEVKKIRSEQSAWYLTDREKEIQATTEKYEKLRELAHGHFDKLVQLHELMRKDFMHIDKKYDAADEQRRKENDKKTKEDFDKTADQAANEGLRGSQQTRTKIEEGLEKKRRDILAGLQLKAEKAFLLDKLKAQLEYLDWEKQIELSNTQLTENEKALIEEQYRQKKMEAEISFYAKLLSDIITFAQTLADVFAPNDQAEKAREDAELARLQKQNDKKKSADQKLLNQKLISQQEYNRRAKILDDQYNAQASAAKKKQWERQKKADEIAAIISGSQAVLSALQTKPFLLGLTLAVIAGIKTKKEIDNIRNQPVPEFATGGFLSGPSHKQGGIDMINSRTGKKVAEAEGGEVLLSKNTVAKNPELVGALLQASMRNNGTIKPFWKNRPYRSIDEVGISRSIQKTRYYENGGVIGETNTVQAGSGQSVAVVAEPSPAQMEIWQAILDRLNTPPKAYVVYSEIQDAGDKLSQIKDDAVFR
ncbi:MAG: hypothetical protein ACTHMV_13555 [Chitinophagaceae bacterium]